MLLGGKQQKVIRIGAICGLKLRLGVSHLQHKGGKNPIKSMRTWSTCSKIRLLSANARGK